MAIHALITPGLPAPRHVIEAQIETLISLLDAHDGDCDLEEDDPPGGDANDVGEVEDWRYLGVTAELPRYGLDQSRGPVNVEEAHSNWERALCAR